MKALQTYELCR